MYLFVHILEILEISDFVFFTILDILEIEVSIIPRTLEIRAAGGRLQGLCCAALDYFWNMFPGISGYPGNLGNMFFLFFPKKTCAEISRRMHRRMGRDLSYETDSGPKTKTVSDLNFQVTAAAATTSQQLSHLARALNHHAHGPNIPFGVNPSLRC